MKNFFDLFKRHAKTEKAPDQVVPALLRMVAMTEEHEFACEQVYALMDQFAELVKRGQDASQLLPQVKNHLAMCPDCREEYEALLKMIDDPTKE